MLDSQKAAQQAYESFLICIKNLNKSLSRTKIGDGCMHPQHKEATRTLGTNQIMNLVPKPITFSFFNCSLGYQYAWSLIHIFDHHFFYAFGLNIVSFKVNGQSF
ncbi:hypothetical protein GQ55_3G073900 [Panicum hallii var. hallii]|uniref:Uncharacterized protein n=1 Tax=Panicum hallii var. hallii TaxID=1504633 RepID=A0A2T7E6Q8_9POAL|nr:hypothetical protein GQ55_3G073900 [Panicum hallii var. hallii]